MPFSSTHHVPFKTLGLAALTGCAAGPVLAHEAWLLTPAEIEALALEPIPAMFQSGPVLFLGAGVAALAAAIALSAEERFGALEERLAQPLRERAVAIGGLVLRLGLSAMLLLAATGGLPRHGTLAWTQPTLLVPDMQLALVPGWEWLVPAQALLGLALAMGFLTRAAGVALVLLSGLGLWLFGMDFMSYAPHFAAPGLMLAVIGGGAVSVDRLLEHSAAPPPPMPGAEALWRVAQILTGGCFVYLAVAYKLTQPTLIIAILEHGQFPSFGLPLAWIALTMCGVEIVCGTLFALGRLTRPVAFVLIGAITFLAVTLGETPFFHANLYGIMVVFALSGRRLPVQGVRPMAAFRRIEA